MLKYTENKAFNRNAPFNASGGNGQFFKKKVIKACIYDTEHGTGMVSLCLFIL